MRLASLGYTLGLSAAVAMLFACGGSQQPIGIMPTSGTADHFPNHKSFYYTGARQSFKVPTGVTRIDIVARGGAGAGIESYNNSSGRGGRVHAVIPVASGEMLYVFVGGAGLVENGGFNGGGNAWRCCQGGFGGGGASDIRRGGAKVSDRILVAGGGGGMGGYEEYGGAGGAGGGSKGGPGGSAGGVGSGGGGGGGTQRRGGSGGTAQKGYSAGGPGESGKRAVGGNGGLGAYVSSSSDGGGGGGGGGGYYGGGGGGGASVDYTGGGGGGGSSYVEPSAVKFHTWPGWKNATGNGLVVISWQ